MKRIAVFILLTISQSYLAQQEPMYSQFWNTIQRANAGYTGLLSKHEAHATGRWQWLGSKGVPTSQLITYAAQIEKINSGLGLTYEHSEIGFSEFNTIKLNYAYHLQLGEDHKLGLGAAGVLNFIEYDYGQVILFENDDYLFLPGRQSGITSDAGIFYHWLKLDVGLGVTQLFDSRSTQNYTEAPHLCAYASYRFGKEDGFELVPQFSFQSDQVKSIAHFNANFVYQSKYLLGIGYRNQDFIFSASYTLKDLFSIGYSYDLSTTAINNGLSNSSHEVHLSYRLK